MLAFDKDIPHYIGSIIQVQKDEVGGVKPFIVIDGQQRLTTIYLLLTALMEFEGNKDRQEVLYDSLFNNFKGEKIKDQHDKYKLKLKANTNDNVQLLKLMTQKIDEIDRTSNIFKNYDYFKKLVREKIESGYSAHDIKRGIEKLTCVVISLNEEEGDNPQVIFERINSTGLDLKLDDLVRNYLLMTEINQEELFAEYWSKIEENIPSKSRENFFIYFLNAYTPGQVNKNNSYDSFKKWSASENKSNEELLQLLARFSKYYSAFIGHKKYYSNAITNKLLNIQTIDQTTLHTFLFYVFDDFENKVIDESVVMKVLQLLENYSIRRIVCEIPSNSLRGLYKNLYKRVFSKIEAPFDYFDVFASFMLNELVGTRDEFPDDKKFRQYLKTTKLYSRNSRLARFLLGTLENYNSKEVVDVHSKDISIEHIMPQNFQSVAWRKELGESYEMIYNTYLDTLGNITLTGYNSVLSDNAFKRKKEILKDSQTKITFINQEFFNSAIWNEEVINKRAERLSSEVLNIYAQPSYSGTSYHKKSVSQYFVVDLENVDAATNTTPLFIEFMGEKRELKTYRDILTNVIETLYELDDSKLRGLAIEKYRPLLPTSNRIYMSTNSAELRRYSEINNSGIYVLVNLSAAYILVFLKELLIEYEIDTDELIVYCKHEAK